MARPAANAIQTTGASSGVMCASMAPSEPAGAALASAFARPVATPSPGRALVGMRKLWRVALALAGALAGTEVPAQSMVWRVPPAGAVEYRRSWKARASTVCRSAPAARRAVLGEAAPLAWLPRRPPAAWLCAGELRADRRGLRGQVGDLRDVLRAIAFDLSGRSANRRFARLMPFGDVAVRGTWSAPDEHGRQDLRGRVVVRPVARRPREPRQWRDRLQALCVEGVTGEVAITRTYDADRGLVTGFRATLDLVVDVAKRRHRRLQVIDEWQLVAVRENQDFDFRRRVAVAIRSGAAWVRDQVAAEASFLADKRGERNYGSGRLALALLAMQHGNVPPDDDVLRRGFQTLGRRRIDDAYSLATALLAMAARSRRTALRDRQRTLAAKWLRQLLTCTDSRVRPEKLLRFNYQRGPRCDTSLQQYGLLGLRAAQQIGLEVPPGAFAAAARHLLAVQAPSEGAMTLRLVDESQLQAVAGTEAEPPAARLRARMRGFAYVAAGDPTYGAMTSAGVSGLLLARAGLLVEGGDAGLIRRIDVAIRDGFAWLGGHFSVRVNPGFAERADNHWSYWLYCLERCCALHGVARLQGRDWYYEGGVQLLAAQKRNGSFRPGHAATLQLDATCFAILFLAKASASGPITGG